MMQVFCFQCWNFPYLFLDLHEVVVHGGLVGPLVEDLVQSLLMNLKIVDWIVIICDVKNTDLPEIVFCNVEPRWQYILYL